MSTTRADNVNVVAVLGHSVILNSVTKWRYFRDTSDKENQNESDVCCKETS